MDEGRTRDPQDFEEILQRIEEVAPGLHTAGTFPARTLRAIAQRARRRDIRHSVETGSGASTLLFSHLSKQHTVFALDDGGSIRNIRSSPLLAQNVVTFVEGPTQATLPRHHFTEKLQLVLIDGPHAYPFPDLEYYFLYPHLEPGALLILDDIQIRTVHHLFEFLKKDAMFRLDQVVEKTAFFIRTDAMVFDPFGHSWWLQNYNARPLFRYVWKERMRSALPRGVWRGISRIGRAPIQIVTPGHGMAVRETGVVEGLAEMPVGGHLWVLVRRKDFEGWWPQGAGEARVNQGRWSVPVTYGGPQDTGKDFEIAALAVGQPTHELWVDWVARVRQTGEFPPVQMPHGRFLVGAAYRTVRKMPLEAAR